MTPSEKFLTLYRNKIIDLFEEAENDTPTPTSLIKMWYETCLLCADLIVTNCHEMDDRFPDFIKSMDLMRELLGIEEEVQKKYGISVKR